MLRQIYTLLQSVLINNKINAMVSVAVNTPAASVSTISAGGTQSVTIDVSQYKTLAISVENTGANALSSLEIRAAIGNGPVSTFWGQTAEFNTPPFGSTLLGASGDLTKLASSAKGWVNLDVRFWSSVVLVMGSTAGTDVSVASCLKS